MGNFDTNPFARAALNDSRLLAGRTNELKKIRFILRNSSKQMDQFRSIMITGSRGVGKTSFLNIIEADCAAYQLIPIRLNLTTQFTSNPNEFFWYLFNQLISKIFDIGLFGGKLGEIDIAIQNIINCEKSEDPATWVFKTPMIHKQYLKNERSVFEFDQLIKDLELIRKEAIDSKTEVLGARTKILFLVDEAHLIYSKKEIIESIRYIVQHPDLGVGFVFAGDESYESSDWENVFGGSHRDFDIIKLGYFNDVDDVVDYFKKSLDSIGWLSDEIENSLFYRLKHTCLQIFLITSGKPEWINFIAKKMFDRCMESESNILRFDKQTQIEVKQILESTGKLDTNKLDYIDSISPKQKKWLSKIFASEFSTLNNVYFFAKFLLTDENMMELEEYRHFCNHLIELEIIYPLKQKKTQPLVGYSTPTREKDVLDIPYLAFGVEDETIKYWLQINSEGKYQFGYYKPSIKFIEAINSEMVTEKCYPMIFSDSYSESENQPFRFLRLIKQINNNESDILNEPYENIYHFYKACKRIANSTDKQVLYAELKNNISKNIRYWNVINLNEKDKLIGFYENNKRVVRFKSNIERYNNNDTDYTFDLCIDLVEKPDIEKFQQLIIKSGDKKKFGIITDDKMSDLYKFYLEKPNKELALKNALFFYELFEEGYDLRINELNNSGYVLMSDDDLEKAACLFREGKRKIVNDELEKEELEIACLLEYNSALLDIKMLRFETSLEGFKQVLQRIKENDLKDETASVLNILELDENQTIVTHEIRVTSEEYPKITCFNFAQHNVDIINNYLMLNPVLND